MRNIEIKAKYSDLKHAEGLSNKIGAQFQWRRKQVDTYFNVNQGRLKLREAENEAAELIGYFRENITESRESRYHRLAVENSEELKMMLSENLGVSIVVSKIRMLYLYKNIRIHLDEVDKLGNFVEFEGVLNKGENEPDTKQCLDDLQARFEIGRIDLVSVSYSDLLFQPK